jgi:hypothetical protein
MQIFVVECIESYDFIDFILEGDALDVIDPIRWSLVIHHWSNSC